MNYRNILIICALTTTAISNANIIKNGSFEDLPNALDNSQPWRYFSNEIDGWYSDAMFKGQKLSDRPLIEVGQAWVYGVTGQAGKNVLELDSNENSKISQNVSHIDSHDYYKLSFLAARRANTSIETNAFEVLWDDKLIATIDPVSTQMNEYSFTFKGDRREGKLSFLATGTSDSYGGIIDSVSMSDIGCKNQPVPEPGTIAALGLGLVGFVFRRRTKA